MAGDTVTTGAYPGEAPAEGKLIDLRHIFAALRRRLWWMVATALVVLALTVITYMLMTPRYTATASLALDRRVDDLVAKDATDAQLTTDSPTVDTAVEVLTSSALAERVVDRLRLDKAPGFGLAADGTPTSPDRARSRAVGKVQGGLAVKRSGLSYAIDVSFTSPDPARAAQVVNAVVEQYIADERNTKVSARERDSQLLRERLSALRNDVIRAETAEAAYRARTNLIDIAKDGTTVQQEISVLNTQLAQARAEEAAANARFAAARSKGNAGDTVSPVIRELRAEQARLSAQRADLAGRYGPLHPDLARVDRQLSDVNRSIAAETSRSLAGLQGEAQVASDRAGAIAGALARARGGLEAGNTASVQLNELQRNAESARGLYQAFLDRYRQTLATEGTERSRAYVIARAMVPGAPIFPNATVFLLGGIVAALLAAVGVVLVLELLENGVASRRQLEDKLGLPVVGTVPDLRTIPGVKADRDAMGPANYVVEHPASLFSEAFRTIRAALRIGHSSQAVRTLAIASALPGEGKTTVSICLARSAALADNKVVIVDCDVRRRTFSRALANSPQVGLTDVLAGLVPLEQALVRDEASGAWILPQSSERAANYELISSVAMEKLVAALGKSFDLVILDCAPVLPLAEARTIAAMADGVLFVTRWRRTPASASQLAVDLLRRANAKVLGGVLSLVDVKQQMTAGYGDEIAYYKRVRKYYVEAA
jgi:capsular exopolysaccharide synthesis family protein